jgi:hypothetical protein
MEQRHITRVMFSAVVHQSRTATAAVKKKNISKEVNLWMTTRASKRTGVTDKGFAGDWLGKAREGMATRNEHR